MESDTSGDRLAGLKHDLEHAIHLLPTQGPISVFVHHNTLHALEELPFEQAVEEGSRIFGSEPWWPESRYREELAAGRIRTEDLQQTLLEDSPDPEFLVGSFGTRFSFRLAMLQYPLQTAPHVELQWILAETGATRRFRPEVDPRIRDRMLDHTRQWLGSSAGSALLPEQAESAGTWRKELGAAGYLPAEGQRNSAAWEPAALEWLWRVVERGVRTVPGNSSSTEGPDRAPVGARGRLAREADQLVHELLIRFVAAYLDQGFAPAQLPDREAGFARSFARLYRSRWTPRPEWLGGLPKALAPVLQPGFDPFASIAESLVKLGVSADNRQRFLKETLLALGGWAGMIWQMETNAPWTPRPAPAGSLVEFLAIRLILDRLAAEWCRQKGRAAGEQLRGFSNGQAERIALDRSFALFQMAQVRGWMPGHLAGMTATQWQTLVRELDQFHGRERRRIFHLAYERRFRVRTLDSLALHTRSLRESPEEWAAPPPDWQLITCIDDREESLRRHVEEVDPGCQTWAAPGFFAVVMYYRGVDHAHFRPLCPINVVPRHYVEEEPLFSLQMANRQRAGRRELFGKMFRTVHSGSRTLAGGVLTGLMGSLATFPLVGRVLAPRLTARLRRSASLLVRPVATELHLTRQAAQPGREPEGLGYSTEEMAGIVRRLLEDIGLTRRFAPLVLVLGHGSSSLNNPHESAYNCGACSGGHGGPNARAVAWMANQPAVREWLREQAGLELPAGVHFVGGFHNTCNDEVRYFDLDLLPFGHRELFRRVEENVAAAVARNAHERSRRFDSVPVTLEPDQSLEAVGERAEDLSQVRPEYNHATTAMCLVGRREWSRGLFLDRRAFLQSYDPACDSADRRILARILAAAIPVCGGISLEYLFSAIDPEVYGCGSKLPHNIVSLAGVMTGAASDLRPGLSQQMTEIHEPVRLLFVVECDAEALLRVISDNPVLQRMVFHEWVQLAVIDPASSRIEVLQKGRFIPYEAEATALPRAASSREWYGGRREHLPFAQIVPQQRGPMGGAALSRKGVDR